MSTIGIWIFDYLLPLGKAVSEFIRKHYLAGANMVLGAGFKVSEPSQVYCFDFLHILIHFTILKDSETEIYMSSCLTSCDNLNDNVSHRFIYFNALSSVGRTLWEGLGGVTLS